MRFWNDLISRRAFLKSSATGLLLTLPLPAKAAGATANHLFWVTEIPNDPYTDKVHPNHHAGIETLLRTMGDNDLKFYRSGAVRRLSGPRGLIASDDVVVIKVNGQWKYRGCTNSDVVRGIIQRILEHPDGFTGEVVVMENGQGRGSLNCDTSQHYSDGAVHANANDETHSFSYLVDRVFGEDRVSQYLLDPIRDVFIPETDHVTDGYRKFENVSYPCFTTAGGNRVELKRGIWTGKGHSQKLKLINIPVLKHHDQGGSQITASLKHVYGILTMSDGNAPFRHYEGLGKTCGKMFAAVRTPVLNIIDAIWVCHKALSGYPADTTVRVNQLVASQDPVALDYWAARHILYPIDQNPNHHPDYPGIKKWLVAAKETINWRGGLYDPEGAVYVDKVVLNESNMKVHKRICNG
ncbi:MAG: DUF362 domain-containing protein [Acidobacteriota bacterium]